MALFRRKKEETKKPASSTSPAGEPEMNQGRKESLPKENVRRTHKTAASRGTQQVLLRPRITEKASLLAEGNVYAFEVAHGATKNEILKAVKDMYKVTPTKVSILPIHSKRVFTKGKAGQTATGKKAYVYLKKGESITFA